MSIREQRKQRLNFGALGFFDIAPINGKFQLKQRSQSRADWVIGEFDTPIDAEAWLKDVVLKDLGSAV